jgi:hypothetical protein
VQDGGCLEEKTCLNQGVGGVMLGNGAGGRRMWACLGVMRTWHPEVPRLVLALALACVGEATLPNRCSAALYHEERGREVGG